MIITEKMIRELQRRVDVSYEDAEKYLRRAGGNIDNAEQYANKRANSFGNRLFREFEKIINATLIYRIDVYKKDDHFINVPILAFIIMLFIIGLDKTLFLGVVFVILALLGDCNLAINKMEEQDEFRFYKTVNKDEVNKKNDDDNSKTDNNVEVEVEVLNEDVSQEDIKKDFVEHENEDKENEDEEDDYFEVTIDK